MKILNNILIFTLLTSSVLMVGCDEFLDERPEKSANVVPETVEDMDLLLGAYRADEISHYPLYGTDDVKPNVDIYNGKKGIYTVQEIQAATWERDLIAKNYKDYFWKYRYENIFKSNLILKVLKTANVSDTERARLEGQAKFKRVYNYFLLADMYCMPYCSENLDEPGLPEKQEVLFSEDITRKTLEETYAMMDADLEDALKLNVALNASGMGANSKNRATTAGVNAFAARYYLAKHDYVNAEKYADEALALYGEDKLMDFTAWLTQAGGGYSPITKPGSIVVGTETIDYVLKYPPTYNNWNPAFWTQTYFNASLSSGFGGASNWVFPSADLISVFEKEGDKNEDLRWKYFFVEQYTYSLGCKYDYPAYVNDNRGTSVAEMILIKAECQARTKDWNDAMNTVNILRAKRINPDSENVELKATSKEEAIEKILEERRREMPFLMRWYDLRRLNNNEYAGDDVTVTKSFFPYSDINILDTEALVTYTLQPKDRRYAAPIPHSEVLSSNGVIEQNKY